MAKASRSVGAAVKPPTPTTATAGAAAALVWLAASAAGALVLHTWRKIA